MSADAGRSAAERVAREGHGRLLALVARRTRDIAAAEDALSDAFAAALRVWPERGAPACPEAWLLTAARRAAGKAARAGRSRAATVAALAAVAPGRASDPAAWPDARLGLMLACADPAAPVDARAPLMLQTVLGLSAARIAEAYLVTPDAMGRRLSRAKASLRAAGARFDPPTPAEADDARLAPALAAVYAAFGLSWAAVAPGADADGPALAGEALWLGRVAAAQAPLSAEAQGLLALMLFVAGRAPARRDASGAYAPLDDQDPRRWSGAMLAEAETTLARAARLGAPGRFQIEAAIQSAHLHRLAAGGRDWGPVLALYEGLRALAPSVGAAVAHAAALTAAGRGGEALALLDATPAPATHQPWWASRAAALEALGRSDEAAATFDRAADLAPDPAVAAFLRGRRQMRKVSSSSTATAATTVRAATRRKPSKVRVCSVMSIAPCSCLSIEPCSCFAIGDAPKT